MSPLQVAEDFTLPIDTATRRIAMLAMPRAGKSNAAVVVAEEMHAAGIPWIAIDPKGDWWGIRASVDGKGAGLPIPVFGGLHGDIPLEPGAGKVIGELIAGQRLTCVLDVSEFETRQEMWGFLTDLAQALYRHNREPLHIFADECHEYLPQKVSDGGNQPKCLGAWTRLVAKGGFRGLGITLISQRSAFVNKDVLYLIDGMIALRTFSPGDRAVIKGWLDIVGGARAKEIMDTLPSLANGEAWVYAPEWIGTEPTRIQFRRRRTFDSGATPEVGKAVKTPAQLADIDIAALGERVAATIERAKADDPKVLRARIAELERARPVQDTTAVDALRTDNGTLRSTVAALTLSLTTVRDRMAALEAEAGGVWGVANRTLEGLAAVPARQPSPVAVESRTPRAQGLSRSARPAGSKGIGSAAPPPDLSKYDRDLLVAIAQRHPAQSTAAQISLLSGNSHRSSQFAPRLRSLRDAGYVDAEVSSTSKRWWITPAGFDALGGYEAPPAAGPDRVAWWIGKVSQAEGAFLAALAGVYPEEMTKQALAEMTGRSLTSSAFMPTLRDLKDRGLIDEPARGAYRAAHDLFTDGAA